MCFHNYRFSNPYVTSLALGPKVRIAMGKYITQRCSENDTVKGTCHLLAIELSLSENCHCVKI